MNMSWCGNSPDAAKFWLTASGWRTLSMSQQNKRRPTIVMLRTKISAEVALWKKDFPNASRRAPAAACSAIHAMDMRIPTSCWKSVR